VPIYVADRASVELDSGGETAVKQCVIAPRVAEKLAGDAGLLDASTTTTVTAFYSCSFNNPFVETFSHIPSAARLAYVTGRWPEGICIVSVVLDSFD